MRDAPSCSVVRGTAFACLLLAIALSIAAAGPGTFALDQRISAAVQRHPFAGSRWIELFGHVVGSSAVLIPVALVVAIWLFVRGRPDVAWLFAGVVLLRPLNLLLKLIIGSPRPTSDQVDVLRQSSGNGFPSGHVTGVVLLAGVVWCVAPALFKPRWIRLAVRALAVAAIVATSYSRVASGAHWPSDVAGGLLWGLTELFALFAFVSWRYRPESSG